MAAHEILKKILQNEICAKRLLNGLIATRSFQPAQEFIGISRAVKYGYDRKNIIFDREVNAIAFKTFEANFTRPAAHLPIATRLGSRVLDSLQNFISKLISQAWRFIFIPRDGLNELGSRLRLEKGMDTHYQPKRLRISASTCSSGIPRRGFFSNSASRRSNSAACSGVRSKSTPSLAKSSLSFCASSIRSAS